MNRPKFDVQHGVRLNSEPDARTCKAIVASCACAHKSIDRFDLEAALQPPRTPGVITTSGRGMLWCPQAGGVPNGLPPEHPSVMCHPLGSPFGPQLTATIEVVPLAPATCRAQTVDTQAASASP